VSAAYPLDNLKTNGFDNFQAAVELIRTKQTKGIFVSYKNDNENAVKIHIASRIFQHREDDANIYSSEGSVVAEYSNDSFTFFEPKKNNRFSPLGKVNYTSDSHILTVENTVENGYHYDLENVKAIILKPYHSATLNTSNEKLAAFCKKAHEKNIPIFVPTVRNGVTYESSKLFENLKLICPPYCTFISLYMKIYAAISLNANIVNFVNKQISHEIIV
jgi:L-asparaginase